MGHISSVRVKTLRNIQQNGLFYKYTVSLSGKTQTRGNVAYLFLPPVNPLFPFLKIPNGIPAMTQCLMCVCLFQFHVDGIKNRSIPKSTSQEASPRLLILDYILIIHSISLFTPLFQDQQIRVFH